VTETAMNQTMLDRALGLAAADYQVLVLQPGTKLPYPHMRGFLDATSDPEQIRKWFGVPGAENSNIGVRPPPGVVVVDVDARHSGFATLKALEDAHGAMPRTLRAKTGGGGDHIFLRAPDGLAWPKNLDSFVGPGIDLKGHDSYVVAAPSLHESGRRYEWIDVSPIAPAPAWLVALGRPKNDPVTVTVIDDGEAETLPEETIAAVVAQLTPVFTEGKKHALSFAAAGWLRQRGWNQSDIVRVIELLPSKNPRARVKDALDGYKAHNDHGWHTIRQLVGDVAAEALDRVTPNPRREVEMSSAAALAAGMAASAVVLQPAQPLTFAPSMAPANANANAPGVPLILQSATHAESILLWRGADRGHQPVALGSLRTVIRDSGLSESIPLFERVEGPGGKEKIVKLNAATIVERNGKSFDRTAYDFARRVSAYDPTRSLVVVGYPNAVPAAAYDPDVDAWLRALAGDAYSRLAVWIASCAQQNITRLAAALVLIGPADVGKSLFSCAVAGLWGAVTPPAASLLVKQFNGELKNCAVVVDEEAQLFGSKQLSTKRFRDLTQSTERSIELKGLETFTLKGALRIIVPCNSVSDLRFTDLGGPDIVQAVIDRLCVIDCKPRKEDCKAALARLRLPGGWVCDRERVIAHMSWICETVALPAERFLGAGAGADSVLAGHVRDTADIWETLHAWLDSEDCSPQIWSTRVGKGLCVNPSVLAQVLCSVGKGWDLRGVRAALEPFKRGEYHPRGEARLWTLDANRLSSALELDADRGTRLAERLNVNVPTQIRLVDGQFGGRGAHHV
jgi:hypothetical protein